MSSYHGGKHKTGLEIAENIHLVATIMEEQGGRTVRGYAECMAGMLGVYRHIPKLFADHAPPLEYKAGDINASVVKMWEKAQKGWVPPTEVTKEEFEDLKSQHVSSATRGFVGHACCFGGQYFGSYSANKVADLPTQSKRVSSIATSLPPIDFSPGTYEQYSDLRDYVIYCDPPYANTENRYYTEARERRVFDHASFLEWCKEMSQHNIVLVSEYDLPSPFKRVWGKKTNGHIYKGRKANGAEGLYIL